MELKNVRSCPLPEAGKNYTDTKNSVNNDSTYGYLFISFSNLIKLLILLKSIVIDYYSQIFNLFVELSQQDMESIQREVPSKHQVYLRKECRQQLKAIIRAGGVV